MDSESSTFASFLQARDPSILGWNRPPLNPAIRVDLCSQFSRESSTISSTLNDSSSGHIRVYLRVKPSKDVKNIYEVKGNSFVCHLPTCTNYSHAVPESTRINKTFTFTKIYNTGTNQKQIFDDCVKERILEFLNGKNATLFTYGNSGSGKTYTILGTDSDPGIIPRSLEYIFRTLPPMPDFPEVKPLPAGNVVLLDNTERKKELDFRNKVLNNSSSFIDKSIHTKTFRAMQKRLSAEEISATVDANSVTFAVWVSFAEIYNEYIYDLLQSSSINNKPRQKLRLGLDANGNTYIKDLTSISVSSGLDAYEILQYGLQKLNYAVTSVNSHSSRSHCVFTIKLAQISSDRSKVQISHFNFCDLAGSERAKNTKNVGDRLKESHNINTSLHVLGRCITIIREKQKYNDSRIVPFRESKLTQLFQPALDGKEAISMIVNITKSNDAFDETQHVLNFSAIAKDVALESDHKARLITLKKRFSQFTNSISGNNIEPSNRLEIQVLNDQVKALCDALERQEQTAKKREEEIRQSLTEDFLKRFNEMHANWSERLKEQETTLTNSYEYKIKCLEEYYEDKLSCNSKRLRYSSVIELDSSTEDMSSDIQEELQHKTAELKTMNEKIMELQQNNSKLVADNSKLNFTVSVLKRELLAEKEKNIDLQKELDTLRKENCNLKIIVAEGEAVFDVLFEREEQTTKTTIDFINLQSKVSDLEAIGCRQVIDEEDDSSNE